ncbi:hypothetical protein DH2020_013225 [Rehmannia glutinosa]|uniref:Uncharacterized protein n=1 Tax=Rehmannia glutinosa TaxID=99300 RepID=A0ABR0X474_REHGL
MAERKGIDSPVPHSDKDVKSPNTVKQAKKDDKTVIHGDNSSHHHKETHGTSDDIDENTPIDEVKGPSVFHRVKEELEAVVEAVIHPKK